MMVAAGQELSAIVQESKDEQLVRNAVATLASSSEHLEARAMLLTYMGNDDLMAKVRIARSNGRLCTPYLRSTAVVLSSLFCQNAMSGCLLCPPPACPLPPSARYFHDCCPSSHTTLPQVCDGLMHCTFATSTPSLHTLTSTVYGAHSHSTAHTTTGVQGAHAGCTSRLPLQGVCACVCACVLTVT